ncbi:MAG: hypothetical protein JNL83_16325 [Myxococcales bacterium]|nr:hypothetical protein [Myxococcales bacterium]
MRAVCLVAVFLGALTACSTPQHAEVDRTACDTCHTADYDTAAVPAPMSACSPTDHVALGYSRACADCHGTTSWCPADATHTRFDLRSRAHAGWDCADCHASITYQPPAVPDPAQIQCTGCHWHSAGKTDPKHLGNGDYTYAPASCVACHPGGRE